MDTNMHTNMRACVGDNCVCVCVCGQKNKKVFKLSNENNRTQSFKERKKQSIDL